MELPLVSHIPLASALTWFAIAASQARGGSLRVSTGVAFVATALLIALYALWDWLEFAFAMYAYLEALLPASLLLVMASLTFLYFAKWLARGRRWGDGLLAIPVLLLALPNILPVIPFLPQVWLETEIVSGLLDDITFRFTLYSTGLIILFILAGINLLRQGALLALDIMGRESWAIIAIMGAASLLLAFAILTNPIVSILQENFAPGFSATLVVPGAMLLAALRRGRGIGVLKLFNLRRSYQGETLAVYLTHETGNLIGAVPIREEGMDDDLFVGTFDAFQSFFNHALPFLEGHTLHIATFGEIAVIMERGQYCYLTVVTTSKRLGLIRDLMRQRLRGFEQQNARYLRDWNGLVDVLSGRESILQGFLPEEEAEGALPGPAEAAA